MYRTSWTRGEYPPPNPFLAHHRILNSCFLHLEVSPTSRHQKKLRIDDFVARFYAQGEYFVTKVIVIQCIAFEKHPFFWGPENGGSGARWRVELPWFKTQERFVS